MVAYKQHMALAGVPFSSEQLLQLMMHKNIMKDKGLHKQILNSISFNFFEKKNLLKTWKQLFLELHHLAETLYIRTYRSG